MNYDDIHTLRKFPGNVVIGIYTFEVVFHVTLFTTNLIT